MFSIGRKSRWVIVASVAFFVVYGLSSGSVSAYSFSTEPAIDSGLQVQRYGVGDYHGYYGNGVAFANFRGYTLLPYAGMPVFNPTPQSNVAFGGVKLPTVPYTIPQELMPSIYLLVLIGITYALLKLD